jgi:16S rRNA (cytosine1402-N4)-methyltransferase
MEFFHKPVLLEEVIDGLDIKKDGIYVDATLGSAGHFEAILKILGPKGLGIGIDRDEEAIENARMKLSRSEIKAGYELYCENFENLDIILKKKHIEGADGILLDIGVSSYQLDNPERGFSYQHDAPLDMRMNKRQKLRAWDIVNGYPEETLKKIISEFGEERWSARIADFIVQARKKGSIDTTSELVDIIKSAIPSSARRNGPHPAKRTFQALRIEVNDELGALKRTLDKSLGYLDHGGRLLVISFHSLEDRIVKRAFTGFADPCECPKQLPVCVCGKVPQARIITKKPIEARSDELLENPRSRSAKLRILEKI